MPSWGNTDAPATKPKWSYERQVREVVRFTTYTITTPPSNTIILSYNDGNQNNVANAGVVVGQYVYFASGLAGNGYPGFFASNNTVKSISGNVVTLTSNTFNTTPAGTIIEFDTAINWPSAPANTYNQDTILITATRSSNITVSSGAVANIGNINQGWNRVVKKVNNDGTIRYLKETLVCLSNCSATNTSSGNTSAGRIVPGL
jgi:hypothetical protein